MKTVTLLTAVTLFTSDAFAHCAGLGSASDGSCNIFISKFRGNFLFWCVA
ncbi:hypothetical protein TUN199_09797 [Pyrenophora tritici-repentis]|nr:hypothetical protein PtrV1_09116 [Pyrenophora tritici-repentis]KAF7443360.1 hypothetical protein A1F99_128670 [Pyrenophora tritici-repentis]KAI0573444.1 hypothetical protein Alg215_09178 [Pyrenophora tritici-repentis]KAI0574027.1 hypothetical protein Alg130_09856 [Pyrenophora tritici-repentis]KAI0604136.1 hypothetical protein TUN205_11617 [Pyrenophora tritici-repentis]